MFQREYDSENSTYYWYISEKFVKGKKALWRKSTRDNALFLSTAIQLNSSTFRNIFNWIRGNIRIIHSAERHSPSFTAHQYSEKGMASKILDLLQAVDIKIMAMKFDEHEYPSGEFFPIDRVSESAREELVKSLRLKKTEITSFHQSADGILVGLDLNEESDGTQVIFSLAGHWLDVLENGYSLIVDELPNSLHPLALKFLVQLFHDSRINSNNAQLIFTSHETSVMAKNFMHQDQIWLLEKGGAENSVLIPLSDYKIRDASKFQKAYLDGRYGGGFQS